MTALLEISAQDAAYVFVGNRIFVLQDMLARGLNISAIFAVRGSHLQRQIGERGIAGIVIETKAELLEALRRIEFDVLVSNGCPFLLPVEGYRNANALLVNIHPSYLPDLRGKDPVPGALMLERDSGATCHRIDPGIDTGDIVAQVKIPYSGDLDAGVLYQLSFLAEKEVFAKAFARNFKSAGSQPKGENLSYFSRSVPDQLIDFDKDSLNQIVRKVTAFGNRSQGVRFVACGGDFKAYQAKALANPYLLEIASELRENEILFCYEDVVVIRKNDGVLKLEKVAGPMERLKPGAIVTERSAS